MNSEYFSLTLITDNEGNFDIYSKILNSLGIKRIYNEHFLKESDKKKFLETGFVFIDINERVNLEKFSNLLFNKDSIIIILSSFDKKDIKYFINDYTFLPNLHFFSKPLDFNKLSKIIENSIFHKQKVINYKSRDDILDSMLDSSNLHVCVFNKNSQIIYSNINFIKTFIDDNSHEVLDFRNKFQIPLNFYELFHRLKAKKSINYESNIDDKFYNFTFFILAEDEFLVLMAKDITEQKNKYAYYTRAALFFEQSNEAVMITDENSRILSVNDSFCKTTGYSKTEAIGQYANLLKSGIQLDDFYHDMWNKLIRRGNWQGEIWNKRKNGEVYSEWLSISSVFNSSTKKKNYLCIFSDVSKILESDEKMKFYAHHDPLTKLLNRRQFENMLKYTINTCDRAKRKFALLYMDIDHFKNINDTYGHDIGDKLLKKVASIFQNVLRKEDLVARMGGDEFCIILNDINHNRDVIHIVEKIISSIKRKIEINHIQFYITLSIGISIFPEHGDNIKELSKNADQSMYEVKKSGRDNFLLYDQSFTDNLLKVVSIQKNLKQAILKRKLKVYYQPYTNAKTGKICGVEALVRLKDKEQRFISSEKLISIAEEHGMIKDVGAYVLKTALMDFANIKRQIQKDDFRLSFNLSSQELFDDGYIDQLLSLTKRNKIDPNDIEIEITETQIMREFSTAIKKFKKLKSLGFNIAIDDFGVGYSSLNYLKMFPIDKLKIDKSFIINILQDNDDKAIAQTIINMAKLFKFKIQAEGVETKEHVEYLKDKHCDFMQGFYFSEALPIDTLISFIQNSDK